MPIRYSSVVGGSGGSGFNLDVGSSGNTTFELSEVQPAGGYSITSQLADTTIEFYAIAEDGTLAGYTNTKSLTASKDFDTMVVYGATNNDLITFEFKETTSPTTSGQETSGVAPFYLLQPRHRYQMPTTPQQLLAVILQMILQLNLLVKMR